MTKTFNRWLGLLGATVVVSSASVFAFTSSPSCYEEYFADGDCDPANNNEECGYDSGDCCVCTCEDTLNFTCGKNGFACVDPSAPCVGDDDVAADLETTCGDTYSLGDGLCDPFYNTPECGYDGGDCCSCTCKLPNHPWEDYYSCKEFACIDPNAICVDDDDVTEDKHSSCEVPEGIGNGYCNSGNNKPECDYDGGDCCECTCDVGVGDAHWDEDGPCGQWALFACIDPAAPCVDDDSVTVDMLELCYAGNIGDGYCDHYNNIDECAYDGGDCCECTCVPHPEASEFACSSFACIDPEAPCVDDDDITLDKFDVCGWPLGIGDGICESDNNKEECDFDGGDCCECTCVYPFDNEFGCNPYYNRFDCQDPTAWCYEGEFTVPIDDDDDDDESMSYGFEAWEEAEPLPTVDGAVEVGTKTEVGVSATAYDVRPGASGGDWGCGEVGGEGCAPANSRDGISSEIESRWSCSSKIVEDEGPCQIEYTFSESQDIVDVLVAFWKGNDRIRTLDVYFDGVRVQTHESYSGSTFNQLGVEGTGVRKVMLESVGLNSDEWISLLEVLIFVTP